MIQSATDMITIGERWYLPMILSISICGPNGMVSTNHDVGVYKGMIIDGEHCHARSLNEQNLHQACRDKAFFVGDVRGYLMLPPTSILSLDHTSPDDINVLSSVYMKQITMGTLYVWLNPQHRTKTWKRKKKSWNKGAARMKNKWRK